MGRGVRFDLLKIVVNLHHAGHAHPVANTGVKRVVIEHDTGRVILNVGFSAFDMGNNAFRPHMLAFCLARASATDVCVKISYWNEETGPSGKPSWTA